MKRRTRLRALAMAAIAAATLAACADDQPAEERIRARIESMQTSLSEGRARAFMAPIAKDFTATTRNLDRRAAGLLLRREMMAHKRLKARLAKLEIKLQGRDRATATMHAVLTGGSGLIPDTGGWYRLETGWRLDESEWMLISARWERVAGT